MLSAILKPDREKSLLRRHPWIFSGAIARMDGTPEPGATIRVMSAKREFLAYGAYSPHSQIAVRVWSFDPDESITVEFLKARLERASQLRQSFLHSNSLTAYRLVNAESDGFPGLIIDRYKDFLVCQFLSAGAEYWKTAIVRQLDGLFPGVNMYERSDASVRQKEGLASRTGILSGASPPEYIEIEEHGLRFLVDIQQGHKTGFYLDQRENRVVSMEYTKHADVLNCFAYTGGFGVYALKSGAASVTNVELAASALELTRRNIEANHLDITRVEQVRGDVFQVLRQYRDARRQFDVIILDPPKFAESRSQIERASRGYKDINLLAFKLLRPGGTLLTFSCSGLIRPELFQKIVADAALDARRDARIIRRLNQAADHPTTLHFPEGSYLKGLVCQTY